METHRTGNSFLRVPATLNQYTSRNPKEVKLWISTEKLADLVLLKIDQIEEQE